MAERYDAIVVGGGHNGLVTAAYLARAGLRVVALERRDVLGGAAVTEEIVPGFRFSVASYVVSLLRPEIVRELELPRHGLEILPLDGTFTPLDGDFLWRTNDHARTIRELRRWSLADAEAYDEYGNAMVQMARFVKPILAAVPPDQGRIDPRQWLPLAGLGRSFADLPRRLKDAFIQLMTMSAADFLDQWFETDPLKATMSASGIIGTFQGVRSPGTAYVLLHHYMGEIDGAFRAWGIPRGGTGGVSLAIASAARAQGAEVRTEAEVARIDVQGGRATGVTLVSGEELQADAVLSSADPRVTFNHLLEPGTLDPQFEADLARYHFRGSSGKVNLALDGLPDFTCLPGKGEHLRGAISFSPSVDYMERAYDDAKYGRFSARPYVDMIIPTLVDPAMAPAGKARHELLCAVRPVPPGRRRRVGRRRPGRLRRHGDRHDRRAGAEHSRPDRRPPGADAARHRAPDRAHRGQHLPGRALAGAALLQPAGARLGPLPDARREPVDVRVGRAPGRRAHGRAGPDRGSRAAASSRPQKGCACPTMT